MMTIEYSPGRFDMRHLSRLMFLSPCFLCLFNNDSRFPIRSATTSSPRSCLSFSSESCFRNTVSVLSVRQILYSDWAQTRPFLLASIIPYTSSLSIAPHRLPFLSFLSQMPLKKSAKQNSKREKKAHVFIFVHIHSLPIGGLILYYRSAVSAQYILYYTILVY